MEFLKRRWKILIVTLILSILVVISLGFYIYTLDYYRALPVATEALKGEVVEYEIGDKMIVFKPISGSRGEGIIFYPGGKVDYLAYAPLMKRLAREGYTCFLMEMPFNLAVFGQGLADGPIERYEEIEDWYMAGHSLGGAMASIYASKHPKEIEGLILLGAYPAADLSDTNMRMLSIYGSEDKILSQDKAEENRAYGPGDSSYYEIQGGNHAYYGSYGDQKKDGQAKINNQEQQEITVREIVNFIE